MNLGKVKRSYKRVASRMLFQAGTFYLIFKIRPFLKKNKSIMLLVRENSPYQLYVLIYMDPHCFL